MELSPKASAGSRAPIGPVRYPLKLGAAILLGLKGQGEETLKAETARVRWQRSPSRAVT